MEMGGKRGGNGRQVQDDDCHPNGKPRPSKSLALTRSREGTKQGKSGRTRLAARFQDIASPSDRPRRVHQTM